MTSMEESSFTCAHFFLKVAIAFTNQLQRSEITYTETLFLTSRGVDSLEDQLFVSLNKSKKKFRDHVYGHTGS